MERELLIEWEDYYYVSGIFIEQCYVIENKEFLIVDIVWEWKKLEPNTNYIFINKEDAKQYILQQLKRDIERVSRYKT